MFSSAYYIYKLLVGRKTHIKRFLSEIIIYNDGLRFIKACRSGNRDLITKYKEGSKDLIGSTSGEAYFMRILYTKDLYTFVHIITNIELDTLDEYHETALGMGRNNIAKYLQNNFVLTPIETMLYAAARGSTVSMLKRIQRKYKLDLSTCSWEALRGALNYGNFPVVKYILRSCKGIDLNKPYRRGGTFSYRDEYLICNAIFSGRNIKLVKYLISLGADASVANSQEMAEEWLWLGNWDIESSLTYRMQLRQLGIDFTHSYGSLLDYP